MALAIPMAIGIGVTIAGCEPETIPDNERLAAHPKSIRVEITDGPANFSRMDLQIHGVAVYHDEKGWLPLNSTVRSVNILSLANGESTTLGVEDNAYVGHYSRVRIWFGANNTVKLNTPVDVGDLHFDAGSTMPLKWLPDSDFVDVKIDKMVSNDRGTTILLDFDAELSVYSVAGILVLDPSMSVMDFKLTGAMGSVVGGYAPAFIRLKNESEVFSAYSTPEGKFLLRGVTPGIYHMEIHVMTIADDGVILEQVYERDQVRVTQGEFTDVGEIEF